jgi:hypothetical protein
MSRQRHYDKKGNKTGWSDTSGSRTRHYDRNGTKVGWSDKQSNVTRHYDRKGTKVGYTKRGGKSGCFISTACCEAQGLPDNCYELTLLRNFRDQYVHALPNGQAIIEEYYRIAPRIVSAIAHSNDRQVVLRSLYQGIRQAVTYIEQEQHSQAFELYTQIVCNLREEYNI